jgi:hypothetical protein
MLRRVACVRTEVSEERGFLQEPHGVTSQKTAFFIVIAVKTSNLTFTNVMTSRRMLYIGNLTITGMIINVHENLKNGVFWVVTPCGSCKNRRFGGTWRLLHQGDKNRRNTSGIWYFFAAYVGC